MEVTQRKGTLQASNGSVGVEVPKEIDTVALSEPHAPTSTLAGKESPKGFQVRLFLKGLAGWPKHLWAKLVIIGLIAAILAAFLTPSPVKNAVFDVLAKLASWTFRTAFPWVFGTAFVQSLLAPILLLIVYVLVYLWRIRGRWFIVVSDFRVWDDVAPKFPDKGVAARLRDELMRLCGEMRSKDSEQPIEKARATANLAVSEARPPLYAGDFVSLPETHVTIQYKGLTIEAFHTFLRRISKREIVVTGDVVKDANGLVFVARTTDDGPWEVRVDENPGALGIGLRRLALRMITTFVQRFLPKEMNVFVFLQREAGDVEEHELAVRLADLGLKAASDRDCVRAKRNLAIAYVNLGGSIAEKARTQKATEMVKETAKAIEKFKKAIELDPELPEAWQAIAIAFEDIGNKKEAGRIAIDVDSDRAGAWETVCEAYKYIPVAYQRVKTPQSQPAAVDTKLAKESIDKAYQDICSAYRVLENGIGAFQDREARQYKKD